MPITRHFLGSKNFLLTRMTGAVDEGELRRHLAAMQQEAAAFRALTELVDCRRMECAGCRSVQDLIEVAAMERGCSWAQQGRLAIVVTQPVAFGMARAYLVGSEGVRSQVHVTYSLEDALARLELDQEVQAFISG